MLKKKN